MQAKTAGILLIGDELLSGKVVDENAAFLVKELRTLGVALRRITTVGDTLEEIAVEVAAFSNRFDFVFTSGGVGPTHDDVTLAAIAQAFGQKIARHPELEKILRGYYKERLEERNLRMADVPASAELVYGSGGGWPTVAVKNVYILPGVPEIFRRKFTAIREQFRDAPFFLRCVYLNADEGEIADRLDQVVAQFPAVQFGSYPRFDDTDYKVKVTVESKNRAEVKTATETLVSLLGPLVLRTADT